MRAGSLFFHLLLLTGCTTLWSGQSRVSATEPVTHWWQSLVLKCIGSARGDFSGLIWASGLPSMPFEGVWHNDFHLFQGEVSDSFGETFFSMTIDRSGAHKSYFDERLPGTVDKAAIDKTAEALAVFGARNLRLVLCGLLSFSAHDYEAIRLQPRSIVQGSDALQGSYEVKSALNFSSGRAKLSSRIDVGAQKGDGRDVRVWSEVSGGFIFSRHLASFEWEGRWRADGIVPVKIRAVSADLETTLTFSEFE